MIEKISADMYELGCDICGETSAEIFDDFEEAVEFKKDKSNGWRSHKNEYGEWEDLCPDCYKERYWAKYGRD